MVGMGPVQVDLDDMQQSVAPSGSSRFSYPLPLRGGVYVHRGGSHRDCRQLACAMSGLFAHHQSPLHCSQQLLGSKHLEVLQHLQGTVTCCPVKHDIAL